METRKEQSRETIVQPWGTVLVPPRGTYITISLSCFADTETTARWEKLTAARKHVDPRPAGTRRLMMLTTTYFTTNQSEECPRADHALFEPLL